MTLLITLIAAVIVTIVWDDENIKQAAFEKAKKLGFKGV